MEWKRKILQHKQARCLILAQAIPLSLHKFILLINLKHITGKSRNFTVITRSHLKYLPQNYKNLSLGKLKYVIFASELFIARTFKETASKFSLLQL